MSDANAVRFGANNAGSDKTELFLKVFAGEVITAFEQHTVTLDKHTIRTIKSGKSAQFPAIGDMPDAEYHVPGQEILGQDYNTSEKTINIDGLLISHVFIPDIDDAMSHFEVRGKLSGKMGQRLALKFDNHVFREIILAARQSTPTVTGTARMVGHTIANDDLKSTTNSTKAAALIDGLYEAAEAMDDKFVAGERYAALSTADYNLLVKTVQTNGFSAINRDYGGEGSFADGNIIRIAGIKLIKTPMVPKTDLSGETYHGVDASKTKAVVWTEDAVGTVKLMDVSLQSQWDIRRQGTLMVARYSMGHGILQPECAVELATETA